MQEGSKKNNIFKALAAVALLCALAGCAFEKNKAIGNDASTIDPETAGFAEVKATSLQKCMECHAGMMGSFPAIAPNLFEINRRIQLTGPGQMPPLSKAQLTEAEKALLLRWIERGAPEASGAGNGNTPILPPKPVLEGFPSPQKEILAAKCVRCHKSIMENLDTFRPYFADAASRITSEFDFEHMPPPAKKQLTEEEMTILLTWLKAQANN